MHGLEDDGDGSRHRCARDGEGRDAVSIAVRKHGDAQQRRGHQRAAMRRERSPREAMEKEGHGARRQA
jgi:hypothetical protein